MEYSKQPLSIDEQIEKLKSRGLHFANQDIAKLRLSSVSYYRLRAYSYPFQNNQDVNHPFILDIDFDDIFRLYVFDHNLRTMILNMLGIIEVAFRTQIIYQFSIKYGSHWQLDENLYRDPILFKKHIESLRVEIDRSTEVFIDHYHSKYNIPTEPPSWMSLEVSSFGLLSQLFRNLKKSEAKRLVARYFGVSDVSIIENWLWCFSNLRNICAHHSRLWNRRFTAKPKLPYNTSHLFISHFEVYPNKLYSILCCMLYVLRIIRPEHNYTKQIQLFVNNCPLNQLKEMGFPLDWQSDVFWS